LHYYKKRFDLVYKTRLTLYNSIRSKTKNNHQPTFAHVFPCFASAGCIYFEFWLVILIWFSFYDTQLKTALQRLEIDLKIELALLFHPISGKTKTNRDSLTWFPALRAGLVHLHRAMIGLLDWRFVFFVIGESDYFGSSLTTLNWKPLWWKNWT